MKRIYSLFLSVLVLTGLASCNVLEQQGASMGEPIRFQSSVGSYITKAGDTAFDEGDRIGLYAMSPLNYFDVALKAEGSSLIPEKEITWNADSQEGAMFYAYYPYESGFVPTRESIFSVATDQSSYSDYTRSDLMAAIDWGSPSEPAVNLVFYHQLSRLILQIDNQPGKEISEVYLDNVSVKSQVNVGDNIATPYGDIASVQFYRGTAWGTEAWMVIVPPQSATPVIRVVTADGETSVYEAPGTVYFDKGYAIGANLVLSEGTSGTVQFSSTVMDWNWGSEYTFTNVNDNRTATIYVLDESGNGDDTLYVQSSDNNGNSYWSSFGPTEMVYYGNYGYNKYDISQCIDRYIWVAFPVQNIGETPYSGGWYIEDGTELFLYRSPAAFGNIGNPEEAYAEIYLDPVAVEGSQLSAFPANPFQRYEMTGWVSSNAATEATAPSYYIRTEDGYGYKIYDISSPDGDLSFIDSDKQVRISFILQADKDGSNMLAQVLFIEYVQEVDERQYSWGIVGEMNGWGETEIQMEWVEDYQAFIGYIEKYDGKLFKIRANGTWDYNYGGPWEDNSNFFSVDIPNGSMSFSAVRDGANISVNIKTFSAFSGTLFVMYHPKDKYLEVGDASFLAGNQTPTTVIDALEAEDGTQVDIQQGIVVATCARGFVIMDAEEACILVYQGANPSVAVNLGDVVRVQGTKTTYYNTAEIQGDLVIDALGTVTDLTNGEVTPDNLLDVIADYPGFQNITKSIDEWQVPYAAPVEVTGVLRANGSILIVDGSERTANFYWPNQDFSYANDHEVTIRGFAVQYNATQVSIMVSTLEVGAEVGPVEIIDISIADLLNVQPSVVQRYRVTGTVDKIANSTYGNLYLADEAGTTVYVYGLTSSDLGYGATNDKSFSRLGIKVGDTITVVGYPAIYKDAFELVYAYPEGY